MAKNVFEATMHELMKRSNFQKISEDDELDVSTEPVDDILTDVQSDVINQETSSEDTDGFIGRLIVDCNLCKIPFFIEQNNLEGVVCPSCMATEEDLSIKGEICPVGTLDSLDSKEIETTNETEAEHEENNDELDKHEDDIDESVKNKNKTIQFDENAMQKIVMNFLTENYKGVKSYKITEARLTKAKKINVSGILEFKSGKTTAMNFLTEIVNLKENKDSSFKVKACCPIFSRANSFVLESVLKEGTLTPLSLSYKFVARDNGKSFSVYGTATSNNAQ